MVAAFHSSYVRVYENCCHNDFFYFFPFSADNGSIFLGFVCVCVYVFKEDSVLHSAPVTQFCYFDHFSCSQSSTE